MRFITKNSTATMPSEQIDTIEINDINVVAELKKIRGNGTHVRALNKAFHYCLFKIRISGGDVLRLNEFQIMAKQLFELNEHLAHKITGIAYMAYTNKLA